MATIPANAAAVPPGKSQSNTRARAASILQRQGVLIALVLLVLFGSIRYENFLSVYNISSVLRFNSMIALIALGMTFVIMTGGIDLSVGSVAALASVVAAQVSPNGLLPAVAAALLVGIFIGFLNGFIIAKLHILPFITTLAMLLAARGMALILANNTSVSASYETDFTKLGQGDLFGINFLPIPAVIMVAAFLVGIIVINYTGFGRHVLAVGGNEEATRLMGLPVDRIKIAVYTINGALAALAGIILASQFGAGQPLEGNGWELSAIASVVVGGTLLTGGMGSVGSSLIGALLLGLIFNILNFENGRGFISLSAYWQSVIRGFFLLVVVLLQNRLARRNKT
jgi:ribose/xylose/arabinose/galactoside ABC-type transport system permease subunit